MMNRKETKNKSGFRRRILPVALILAGLASIHCEDKQSKTSEAEQAVIAGVLARAETQTLNSATSTYSNRWVTAKRVRYCRNLFCTKAETPYQFRAWENWNVDRGKQRDTYIATLKPSNQNNIENIVFFSAGQQTLATTNVLTGQPKDYRKNCSGKCKSKSMYIDGRSLAVHLMNQSKFSTAKTLYVLVFDARFNHGFSTTDKYRAERAYYDYLVTNVNSWKIKRIILGGSSRGGALAYRLAKRFRGDSRYNTKATIVQGFDATFIKNEEMGAGTSFYSNPYHSGWKGRYTNLSAQFPYKTKLALHQLVGGKEAFPLTGARGFAYTTANSDSSWFRQRWVNIAHGDIGSNYAYRTYTVARAIGHINTKLTEFGL